MDEGKKKNIRINIFIIDEIMGICLNFWHLKVIY